ncbi:MAG: enoyl-CoA hydratase/isomerase family protein [Anaerolineae bacterium]
MPEFETMYWEKDGPVARVTLNRPEVLNAQNNQATYDLNTVADQIAPDRDVRLVAISGAGRAFCTGIDLKELSAGKIDITYHDHWESALRKFETMEPVVLCLIHGYCLGGGLQLAMASDIRVSTPSAQIGLPAIRESLIPGLGTWRLPRYIGMGRAKQLIISGDNIDGQEAQRIGLVDHLVSEEAYREEFEDYIQKYQRSCSKGTRMSKLATNRAFDLDFESFYQHYINLQAIAMTSRDFFEAGAAYQEEREPEWE